MVFIPPTVDVNKFIEEVVRVPLEFSDAVDNRGVTGKLVVIVVLIVGNDVVSEARSVDISKPSLCVKESNKGLDDNASDVIKRPVDSVLEAELGSTDSVLEAELGSTDSVLEAELGSTVSVLEAELGSTETVPGVLVDVILSVSFREDGLYV